MWSFFDIDTWSCRSIITLNGQEIDNLKIINIYLFDSGLYIGN